MAIPADQKKPQVLMISASVYSPIRSTGPPPTFMPDASAITVRSVAVMHQRRIAARPYPSTMPVLFGEASISRRAKPPSKSRATPKPVKTPPKAADWRRTKTNWKAVYPFG